MTPSVCQHAHAYCCGSDPAGARRLYFCPECAAEWASPQPLTVQQVAALRGVKPGTVMQKYDRSSYPADEIAPIGYVAAHGRLSDARVIARK